jgi:hypothetical protein
MPRGECRQGTQNRGIPGGPFHVSTCTLFTGRCQELVGEALSVCRAEPQLSSCPLVIVIAQSNLDVVEPSSIPLQPVCRRGLEDGGPELEMGGAVGFSFDRRQAELAGQGLRRKNLGYLAQSQRDAGGPPFPPPFWELIAFKADQHHVEGAGVAVAVEVNTGVPIAEQRPDPQPVCSAINNPEAQFFEETERLLYLRRPPVRHLRPHLLIQALTLTHMAILVRAGWDRSSASRSAVASCSLIPWGCLPSDAPDTRSPANQPFTRSMLPSWARARCTQTSLSCSAYSAAIAVSMSSRAARRAGPMLASTPAAAVARM